MGKGSDLVRDDGAKEPGGPGRGGGAGISKSYSPCPPTKKLGGLLKPFDPSRASNVVRPN